MNRRRFLRLLGLAPLAPAAGALAAAAPGAATLHEGWAGTWTSDEIGAALSIGDRGLGRQVYSVTGAFVGSADPKAFEAVNGGVLVEGAIACGIEGAWVDGLIEPSWPDLVA